LCRSWTRLSKLSTLESNSPCMILVVLPILPGVIKIVAGAYFGLQVGQENAHGFSRGMNP
jgi:hypothetical protein